MLDPTAELVTSVAAGVTAVTLAALGVEPQALMYAAMGGFAGMAVAPNLGRIKALATFFCVMCLCAAFGTWVAQHWQASLVARNIVAGASAAVFHPLFSLAVQRLPEMFDGVLKRVGLK